MNSLLARACWITLLVWCFGHVALLARPVSGDLAADDQADLSSKSAETTAGSSKSGPSFPSVVPDEMPFGGDAELLSSATRATGSVVLLSGLLLIGSFLLKRYWPGRFGAAEGQRHIEVLETVALGERQSLTLVQIGQSRLLLGRTAGSITLLDRAEFRAEEVTETETDASAISAQCIGSSPAMTDEAGRFKRVEASLKAVLARVKAVLRPCTANPTIPTATGAFEQLMRAELSANASSGATTKSATRSRLSEIRARLQGE